MNLWALAAGEAIPHSWELGPITRSDCVRYQGASGDFEPIHHDEPFALSAGYDAPLIIGMYPAGAVSAWMATLWGVDSVRETTIRWTGQVWPGDSLRAQAIIEEVEPAARWVAITLSNQGAQEVLRLRMRLVQTSADSDISPS